MAIAFFDLDKTILSVNSGTLWVRREVALGFLSKREALRAAVWLTRYALGFASGEALVADAIAQLENTSAAELQARTVSFFEAEVRHTYRPLAREVIEKHRLANDRLVMLTSSTNYLSELVARELRFDAVLCNRLEVAPNGLHTGRVTGRVCFADGKLAHAQAAADESGTPLRDCSFYTDSYSDRSVLERVGRPVAVNPDPRLKRHARRRGWPVVDWGAP